MNDVQTQDQKEKYFLNAWKKGIKLIGEEYFVIHGSIEEADTKSQLQANLTLIRENLLNINREEAFFLASMYSLYSSHNAIDGILMLRILEAEGFPKEFSKLNKRHMEVLEELKLNASH